MRQPPALFYLFLTELWERYGFYVVQGLLVLYLTQYFHFSDKQSYSVLGVFTGLIYVAPIAGGYLADRVIGFKPAIVIGGLFLIVGYAMLALPSPDLFLSPGLATIIVGNGLFKPNVSSLLGTQYETGDTRRDSGFTIFYIGINLGAFLAGLSSGYIKDVFGWQVGFGCAAAGLVIGLLTFLFGLRHIKSHTSHFVHRPILIALLPLIFIFSIVVFTILLNVSWLADFILPVVGVLILLFLIVLISKQPKDYRPRMIMLLTLILASVIFWMIYFQMFFSANLFVDRLVNKNFLGLKLTTTQFYGSESIFVILFGPLFAYLWHALSHRQKNPSPVIKFILGLFFLGLGFLILSLSTFYPNTQMLINPLWIFGAYFFVMVGELLLSPIGLSAITSLSPPYLVGMMMGVWFVASGYGGIFAGWIADEANIPTSMKSNEAMLHIYQHAFLYYAYYGFVAALVLFILYIPLKHILNKGKFIGTDRP